MERQKSILGRKKRVPAAAPGDFIALGKQSKPGETEVKRSTSPQLLGRKKDAPGPPLSSASLAKKPKLGGPAFGTLGRPHGDASGVASAPGTTQQYDEIAVTVEPTELLPAILAAEDDLNDERVEGLLCGAVKHLRSNRSKPDQIVYLTLMYLSKSKPALFCSEIVIEAFCGLLKRELALTFKAKGNPTVSVLACNVLMNAFADEENWPDNFVKVFVEDSLGERVWVDRDDCRSFVDNIHTAFGTKKSPKHLLMATAEALRGETGGSASPAQLFMDDEDSSSKMSDGGDGDRSNSSSSSAAGPPPRYPCQQQAIETYIMDTIRDILNRRQSMDSSSRNLIRLMTSTSGYGEVRNMAAQRIDMWLQNPKLTRVSQDLLLAVCTNCDKHDQTDLEVIGHLTKMRMKTKPLINHFLNCMRELLSQHTDNLRMILNHTIYNELSTSRNPNNMALLAVLFSHSPDQAAKVLAEIFQDLLTNKDDYLKALRMLLREVVRCTRLDMNFSTFCLGLMQERTEQKFVEMEPALKERYIVSIADLISLDILLSVAPNIREAAAGLMQGDHKNLELIHVFKRQVGVIQRDSVWWLHMVVPKIAELKADAYLHCLKKVLFLESIENYYNKDNWPQESERALMLQLASESPVMEDTLMRLLVIGLLRDLPLSAPDAVELVDQLVCRAAALYHDLGLMDVLQMERLEFIDALLNLCVYKHPENIVLPQGYTPPNLAITGLMWKAWLTLLIITAFNPTVFGETAWQKYPTLQALMEMVMTNNYTFPPPTMATDDKMAEEFKARERQIRQQEIHLILEFETHLAAATSKVTITESNSLLIGQLNHNDPTGPARFPPQEIMEQLKHLNQSLKLGQMLCRSRNPDFLLRIINRQGTSQSMPWLAELVESSEGSLDVLPIQCLCEFLLHEPTDFATDGDVEDIFGADRAKRKEKNKKHRQLLTRLQDLVHSTSTESKTVKEVLDYFLQRLASTQASTRQQAVKGLSSVVTPAVREEKDESMDVDMGSSDSDDWLLVHMPLLPLFHEVKESLCLALRKACQVETDPRRINTYILFLSEHALDKPQQNWNDLALDVAQLLVERTSVVSFILPEVGTKPSEKSQRQCQSLVAFIKLFVMYMRNARKEDKDTFSWSNTQDQILLHWEAGQSATVHVLVVHAMIVLLTYGKPRDDPDHPDNQLYDELLNMWIQDNGRMPSGYLLDTSEEALLLPDWLKLRMLRSADDKLISAALLEVEPTQLILFVQSFGIPVASMSRLLAALDQAVASDAAVIAQAVQDASYMANLVEIQHERGAIGGQAFYSMLTQGKDKANEEEESKPDEEMTTEDTWNVKGTGEVILPNSADKLARLLDQIFSDTTGSESGPAKHFQWLLQAVSTDKKNAAAIIKAFDNLLSSSKREAFAQKVYTATFRSCPILKVLVAKQPDLHGEIYPVMEKLHSLSTGQRSMLTSVVTQFLASNGKSRQTKGSPAKLVDDFVHKCSTKKGTSDSQVFIEGLKKLKDPESMEIAVQRVMENLLAKGKSQEGTKLAGSVLTQAESSSMTPGAATLLIDWLSLLDPEIVQSNPELLQQLLFARKVSANSHEGSSSGSVASQAHLLALLTHQTSWSTLTRCLIQLLQPDKTKELDPTAVLDFISACEHIPKIWQGREKRTPEIEQKEDVLSLTALQLSTVVDFILEEALLLAQKKTQDPSSGSQPSCIMKSRMDLLMSCVCDDIERVVTIVNHLQKLYDNSTGLKSKCAVSLATSLYLQYPYIQSWLAEDSPLLSELMSSSLVQSQMDVISHRLISSLGQINPGGKTQSRMYDANIACRKMAAHHPAIFLRQLPLIGAILSGQTQFTSREMRHTNRFLLFTHVLGLLELLQPHVFSPEHAGLLEIFDSFFSLLQIHGEEKALGPQVHKLVLILQNFLTHDPQRALPMLQKQLPLLSNLALVYQDMFELKALLTSLTLPRQSETRQGSKETGKSAAVPDALTNNSSYTAAQLLPFMRRFNKESSEDLLTLLQDLDELSKRKVEVLFHFESQLRNLMMSPSDQCRGTAFSLIMRALRQNPKKAENFVAAFLDCLGSENPDIVNTALKNLAEFTALCQEEATSLLQKAFTVGIKNSLDTSTYISETLHMLNLHSSTVD